MSRPEGLSTNFSFDEVIAPISRETFFDEYWEKKPLYIPRSDASFYGELSDLSKIDGLISRNGAFSISMSTAVVDPETGENHVRENGVHGQFAHQDVYNALHSGQTLRIRGIEDLLDGGQAAAAAIQEATQALVRINMYMTPKSAKGFGAHQDAHDVMILQASGEKHWTVYEDPVAIPSDRMVWGRSALFGDEKAFRSSLPRGDNDKKREIRHDIVLRSGDFLYMPRGWYHEAHTTDQLSMHYTVGLYPLTWHDSLVYALAKVFENDVRIRHALPPGFASGQVSREELQAGAETAVEAVRETLNADFVLEAIDSIRARYVASRNSAFHGFIENIDRIDSVGPDTVLQMRKNVIANAADEGNQVVLSYNGRRLKLPSEVKSVVEFIRTGETFTAASMPCELDDANRLRVAQYLVTQGVATIVASPRVNGQKTLEDVAETH